MIEKSELVEEKAKTNTKILKLSKASNEPYKYKSRKEAPELKWPLKTELFDTNTFSENLTILNGIQPIFNTNKINKHNIKLTFEEIKQDLQTIYGFKNIKKFKESALTIMYNILKYDKIFLE